MGCDETRVDIEEKMLYTRLERDEIRKQRKLLLEELKLSTGENYKTEKIPDYVDIEYIKEKKRKHEEKLIKAEVERLEEIERKERKRREEEEKLKEEEKINEEYIYMPMDMKVKSHDNDLEDIYYLNYVLEKKDKKKKEKHKDKDKDRNKKKRETKRKKEKHKNKHDDYNDKEEDNNNYDFIEPVNAKIRTKIGSEKSVIEEEKKIIKNKEKENLGDKSINDNDNSVNISKDMPYVTPHLNPND